MKELLVGSPPLPLLDDPWSIRPVRPDGPDLDLVWRWMNEPHAAATWNQAWSKEKWHAELTGQLANDVSLPCLVSHVGMDVAYVEVYWVIRHPLGELYPVHPHDLGVHIAFGELDRTRLGLGSALLRAVAIGLVTADPECTRVVGEPNVDNKAIIRACVRAGSRQWGEVTFPHKTAALMVWSREENGV